MFLLLVPPDDDERPSVQQQPRTPNTNIQSNATQAMKMILEEDEYPESPPTE